MFPLHKKREKRIHASASSSPGNDATRKTMPLTLSSSPIISQVQVRVHRVVDDKLADHSSREANQRAHIQTQNQTQIKTQTHSFASNGSFTVTDAGTGTGTGTDREPQRGRNLSIGSGSPAVKRQRTQDRIGEKPRNITPAEASTPSAKSSAKSSANFTAAVGASAVYNPFSKTAVQQRFRDQSSPKATPSKSSNNDSHHNKFKRSSNSKTNSQGQSYSHGNFYSAEAVLARFQSVESDVLSVPSQSPSETHVHAQSANTRRALFRTPSNTSIGSVNRYRAPAAVKHPVTFATPRAPRSRSISSGTSFRTPSQSSDCSSTYSAPRTPRRQLLQTRLPSTPGRSPYAKSIGSSERIRAIPTDHDLRITHPSRSPRVRPSRSLDDIATNGGPFTQLEDDELAAYCEAYQAEHQLTASQLNDIVQGTGDKKVTRRFFTGARQVLIHRKRRSIRDHLQRSRHNLSKGAWTVQEDEQLAECIATVGRKWKQVEREVGRTWEDCRDRYRNYHTVENQRLTRWSNAENTNLRMAVGDCVLDAIRGKVHDLKIRHPGNFSFGISGEPQRQDLQLTIHEQEASEMLLWETIANLVPQRSRLQCYQRWNRMRSSAGLSYTYELRRALRRSSYEGAVIDGVKINTQGEVAYAPGGMLPNRSSSRDGREHDHSHRLRRTKQLYGGDRIALIKAVQLSGAEQDDQILWSDSIRKCSTAALGVFPSDLLAHEWENIKSQYQTSTGKQLSPSKTRKSARRLYRWLNETLTTADKSRQWALIRETTSKKKRRKKGYDDSSTDGYKSSEYVDSDDDDDKDDDDGQAMGGAQIREGETEEELRRRIDVLAQAYDKRFGKRTK